MFFITFSLAGQYFFFLTPVFFEASFVLVWAGAAVGFGVTAITGGHS